MFADQERADRIRRHNASKRESWMVCWGWPGPEIGELGQVGQCVVKREDGESIYAYCELVRFIERRPDGKWLAEIDDAGSHKVIRVVLDEWEIWAPVKKLIAERNALRAAA